MTAMPGDTGLVVLLPFAGDAAAESMAQGVRLRFSEVWVSEVHHRWAERPEDLWGRLSAGMSDAMMQMVTLGCFRWCPLYSCCC